MMQKRRLWLLSEEFKNLGFVKMDYEKHQLRYNIQLIGSENNEDDFGDLFLLRDKIEDEIEEEIIGKSMGNHVGSEGTESVYDIWNFEDIRKSTNQIIMSVLKKNKIDKFKVFINNNIEIDQSK